MIGDVEVDAVHTRVRQAFGARPRGGGAAPWVRPARQPQHSRDLYRWSDDEEPLYEHRLLLFDATDEDVQRAHVLRHMLHAELTRSLRHGDEKLAYGVSSAVGSRWGHTRLRLTLRTSAEHLDEVEAVTRALIDDLRAGRDPDRTRDLLAEAARSLRVAAAGPQGLRGYVQLDPVFRFAEPPDPVSADLPAGWEGHVASLREAAGKGAQATDLATAADALAATANACGACHEAMGAKPDFPVPQPPVNLGGPSGHMHRHAWAADRMWEGLILPDATRYEDGVRMLREDKLEHASGGKELPAGVAAFATRVHEIAVDATDQSDPATRAKLFGDFLAQCGACHGSTGEGPP